MLTRKVNIGQMDRKITIEQSVTVKDEYGQDVPTWQTFKTVYAKIEDAAGSEHMMSDQMTAVRTTTMTIRHMAVNEAMRVVLEGAYYNIVSIQRPDRRGYLILKCELRDDNG